MLAGATTVRARHHKVVDSTIYAEGANDAESPPGNCSAWLLVALCHSFA